MPLRNINAVISFWMTSWKESLLSHQTGLHGNILLNIARAQELMPAIVTAWPQAHKLTSSQAQKLTSSKAHKLAHRPTDRVAGGADAGSGDSCQLLLPVQASHLGNNRSKVSKAGRSNHRGSVIPEEEVRGRWPRGPLGSSVSVGFTSVGVRQSGESCGCRLQLPGSSPAR